MIDEPLVVPVSPGTALVRLAQITGALQRHTFIAGALPANTAAQLETTRDALWRALAADDFTAVETALRTAQSQLLQIYEALAEGINPATAEQINPYTALHFPDPRQMAQQSVQPVDVRTVIATFAKPVRQVMTNLSFQDAAGATAYWLQEIRTLRDERLDDFILEVNGPLFSHVRIPVGRHVFRIESRNSSEVALSEEFTIEVPDL